MTKLQLTKLHSTFDELQKIHGEKHLSSIYGAGCTEKPKFCLMFMNPTARNISCLPEWEGMRAPRIALKQTRKMLHDIGLVSSDIYIKTQGSVTQRSPLFVEELYQHLAGRGIYITNLAKCTQSDAKHLPDSTFRKYLPSIHEELTLLQPEHIITFGNQVSSILLQKPITVGSYENKSHEVLKINNQEYNIYPCRYPVGMGYRNIHKAKQRITDIMK